MTAKEFEMQYALGSLSYDDKIKLTGNKRTSKKILTILSTDEDWNVRSNVADNPNTPKDVLKVLSKDKYWGVRYWVAGNLSRSSKINV